MKKLVQQMLQISGEDGARARDMAQFLNEPVVEVQKILYQMKKDRKAVCFQKHWYSANLGKTPPVKRKVCWCGLALKRQQVQLMDRELNVNDEWVCPVHTPTVGHVGAFNPKNTYQTSAIASMFENCIRPTAMPGQWEEDMF
jgi:hypothetical protein